MAGTKSPPWSPPPLVLSPHAAIQASAAGAIDVSRTGSGYVTVAVKSGVKTKLQVAMGDAKYNVDVPSDGTPTTVPLTLGTGEYLLRVMRNTSGNRYVETYRRQVYARVGTLSPFVRPNVVVPYGRNSRCVSTARDLTASCKTQRDAVKAVCAHVIRYVAYDTAKANALRGLSGYRSDPDETLARGLGICLDYAVLGAAMLRSIGVPTRVVTGSVITTKELGHAWVDVWCEESWKCNWFEVKAAEWSRIDLTMAAGTRTWSSDGYLYDAKSVW